MEGARGREGRGEGKEGTGQGSSGTWGLRGEPGLLPQGGERPGGLWAEGRDLTQVSPWQPPGSILPLFGFGCMTLGLFPFPAVAPEPLSPHRDDGLGHLCAPTLAPPSEPPQGSLMTPVPCITGDYLCASPPGSFVDNNEITKSRDRSLNGDVLSSRHLSPGRRSQGSRKERRHFLLILPPLPGA